MDTEPRESTWGGTLFNDGRQQVLMRPDAGGHNDNIILESNLDVSHNKQHWVTWD